MAAIEEVVIILRLPGERDRELVTMKNTPHVPRIGEKVEILRLPAVKVIDVVTLIAEGVFRTTVVTTKI